MADTIFDNNAAAIAGIDARWIKATSGKTTLSSAQDASYSLDATDTADYFKLTVSRSSNVIIKLDSQGGNANVSLLDFDGTSESSSVGSVNNNTTGLADVIISDSSVPLQAGQDYYIRVNASNPTTSINYTLTIDTLPTSRSDILWRDYQPGAGGGNYIWGMNDTQLKTFSVLPAVDPSYILAAAQDFNKDGNPDYLWRDPVSGIDAIWMMDATGVNLIDFVLLPSVPDPNWRIVGATDFNKDGNTDILWQYTPTGQSLAWLLNEQSQYTSSIDIASPEQPNTYGQAVQDFNGDGTPDIFYRDFNTGSNSIWLLDDTGSFVSALNLNPADPTWLMNGVADFNGDGKSDLFWRNYVTGENIIWYMDQTTFLSSAYVETVNPRYQVAALLTNAPAVDLAGSLSTADSAFSIGKLDGTAQYNDKIGGKDAIDYYSFTLDVASKIDITAIGAALAATTNFQVEAADGTLVSSVSAANGANQQKLTDITLDPGTYFVRLQSTSTSPIDYSISIGATAKLPVNLFPVAPLALKNTNGTPITSDPSGTVTIPSSQAVSVKDPFTFDLDYIVKYTGRPTNSFKVGFFLSTDATITNSDYRLDTNNDGLRNADDVATVTGLAPDTNGSRTQRLTLPSKDDPFWTQDGRYYIGVIVDPENEIVELDPQGISKEDDNTLGTSFRVKDARLPDLTGSGFDVSQSSAVRGSTITVSGRVLNIGTAASDTQNPVGSEFDVGFYLSTDNTFSSGDFELTFSTFAPITANSQVSFNSATNTVSTQRPYFDAPVVLPLNWAGYQGNGTYYVLMVVDPGTTVKEISGGTQNNVMADAIFIDV